MLTQTEIYRINLAHRKDRLGECYCNQISKDWSIHEITHFNAINEPKSGALGCAKSHVAVLTKFLTETSKPLVMVLEDDFDFEVSKNILAYRLDAIKSMSWDAVLLAGTGVVPSSEPVNGVIKIFRAYTTSGYIVNRDYAWKLLECFVETARGLDRFRECDQKNLIGTAFAVDIAWQRLQRMDNWLLFTPRIGRQRHSFSDIEGKLTDYDRMFYE